MYVPTMAEFMASGEQPEVLFWVDVPASFDQRAQKTRGVFITILDKVGIKYAILEKKKCITPARRAAMNSCSR